MKMSSCKLERCTELGLKIRNQIRSNFFYKIPLSTDSLLEKVRNGSLFGYIQCDLVVPDELKEKTSSFRASFKNTEMKELILGTYAKLCQWKWFS